MVQGCWSVVPVCATSYSWKTGPHWGTMESPQTAAGTREPATTVREIPGLVSLAAAQHVPSSVRNKVCIDRAVIAARTSHGATPRLS